jgi:glutamate 5-kinase
MANHSEEALKRATIVSQARRVVIKLGTNILMRADEHIALSRIYGFIESVADLKRAGREVLLVSSGAVGLGRQRLGLEQKPEIVTVKQACAAVGQGRLMALYSEAFDRYGITVAQVLLTEEDFTNRQRYLNLRGALSKLLELNALPIINENDTVSIAELEESKPAYVKVSFGDNDKLSALVASKIEADLLVLLTDVDGLYSCHPATEGARLIPVVDHITPEIKALVCDDVASNGSKVGRGGFTTKLEAAEIAMLSGCAAIVANGKHADVLSRVFSGEEVGTLFLPRATIAGKRRWIAFASSVRAALVVNRGAFQALTERKASLLAAGVLEVRGDFDRGDVVSVLDENEREFARGMVNYSSLEARKISGKKSAAIDELIEQRNYDALITRDNIVILQGL